MADTFLIDPLGRQITLHDRTWYGHILPGHPDMHDHRVLLSHAISDPLSIRFDLKLASVRRYIGIGPRSKRVIMVAADVELGLVKSAFVVPERRVHGEIEWQR